MPVKKLMVTFLEQDRKEVLMVEFEQQGTTMPQVYCKMLKNSIEPMRTKGIECGHPV
jgi:hypothetical protein